MNDQEHWRLKLRYLSQESTIYSAKDIYGRQRRGRKSRSLDGSWRPLSTAGTTTSWNSLQLTLMLANSIRQGNTHRFYCLVRIQVDQGTSLPTWEFPKPFTDNASQYVIWFSVSLVRVPHETCLLSALDMASSESFVFSPCPPERRW